ncbi:CsbD family protein [Lichenihabitans sp. Uapishka_5]|uniref:CsbD family protein n=1 Tax=Lichenihabitans sp. Uapishka_5 TaxID=3037302 RepID=UPI0029E7CE93|nr:CsbD family protein [Lichenihabitans sp. Uapishka_5]MDX7951783.1 CsbD family protein [Lichenihabitans sp. Uapishka_5]
MSTATDDKASGMANKAAGSIKQGIGNAVGDSKLQTEGAGQKAKGSVQEAMGDAKQALKDGLNHLADKANKTL